jgi:hypothetical protein
MFSRIRELYFTYDFYDCLNATSYLFTILVCYSSVQTRRRVAAICAVAELS